MAQSAEYVGVAECFCGEGPKDADWLALACGHVAHEECLERWAEGKTAPCCPSCREPAPELKKKSKARRLKLFLTNQDQGSLFASSQAPSNDERIEKFRDLLRRERAHALELQQSLIKAQCSIADHEAQCKQQDAKVAKYRADKSEAVLQLAVLQGTIQKLTAELGQVQTELAQERKQHVNSVQQLSKEKSELQGRMSKLETSLRSMQFKLNQQQVRSNPQMSREDIQRLLCTQAGEEVLDGLAESALAELLVERTREVQAVQQRSEALRRRHQEELQVLRSAAADMKRAAEQEQVRLRQENDRCRLELTAMEGRLQEVMLQHRQADPAVANSQGTPPVSLTPLPTPPASVSAGGRGQAQGHTSSPLADTAAAAAAAGKLGTPQGSGQQQEAAVAEEVVELESDCWDDLPPQIPGSMGLFRSAAPAAAAGQQAGNTPGQPPPPGLQQGGRRPGQGAGTQAGVLGKRGTAAGSGLQPNSLLGRVSPEGSRRAGACSDERWSSAAGSNPLGGDELCGVVAVSASMGVGGHAAARSFMRGPGQQAAASGYQSGSLIRQGPNGMGGTVRILQHLPPHVASQPAAKKMKPGAAGGGAGGSGQAKISSFLRMSST